MAIWYVLIWRENASDFKVVWIGIGVLSRMKKELPGMIMISTVFIKLFVLKIRHCDAKHI